MSLPLSLSNLSENKPVTIEEKARARVAIEAVQNEVAKHEQIEAPITNFFSQDVYAREMKLKKGDLIVGKIHKFKNLNIISKGKVTFFSTDGQFTVEAPFTFVAEPGAKRVILAREDTVWTTIHGTAETDLKKIEDQFIAKDYDEVEGISEEEMNLIQEARKCLG